MVAIDATLLLLFLSPIAEPPLDRRTGKPLANAKERVDALIDKCQRSRTKIVVPTPVLSEVLVRAGAARTDYLRILQQSSHFKIAPFDVRAAVDVAEMTKTAIDAGDKRAGSAGTWAKVKFDRQIVAIAKNEQVTAIYSDDPDIKNTAAQFGIPVIGLFEMPVPAGSLQGTLPLLAAAAPPLLSASEEDDPELPEADEGEAAMSEFDEEDPAVAVPHRADRPEKTAEVREPRVDPKAE